MRSGNLIYTVLKFSGTSQKVCRKDGPLAEDEQGLKKLKLRAFLHGNSKPEISVLV